MKLLDRLFERSTRHVADTTSRRNFLGRLGSLMVAGAALPVLLPIDRTSKALPPKRRKPVIRVIPAAAITGATAPSTASSAAAAVAP